MQYSKLKMVMLAATLIGGSALAQDSFIIYAGQDGSISPFGKKLILQELEDLPDDRAYAITLSGFTDTRGTAAGAELRTQWSLDSVAAEVRKALGEAVSIEMENLADTELAVPTADNVGEPKNRYVKVQIDPVALPDPVDPPRAQEPGALTFSLYSEAATSSNFTFDYAEEARVKGDFESARRIYEFYANGGERSGEAAWELASMASLGEGQPVSQDEAFRWALKAAENGYPPALSHIAERYRVGIGTDPNKAEAKRWAGLAVAENSEDADALYTLGMLATETEDWSGAKDYFIRAGRIGHVESMKNAGLLLSGTVEGPAPDKERALKWLNLAAAMGNIEAADLLADIEPDTKVAPQTEVVTPAPTQAQQTPEAPSSDFPVFADTALSPLGDASASCALVLQEAIDTYADRESIQGAVRLTVLEAYRDLARNLMLAPEHNGGLSEEEVEAALVQQGISQAFFGGGPALEDCRAAGFLKAAQ